MDTDKPVLDDIEIFSPDTPEFNKIFFDNLEEILA